MASGASLLDSLSITSQPISDAQGGTATAGGGGDAYTGDFIVGGGFPKAAAYMIAFTVLAVGAWWMLKKKG